eukprot:TRINITY_DN17899_c0_g1_i2.p2 TRINITY_DN17899_c0_g1~~TRINITY_DN17899_c0_g1_i2.p2  ORF type:complete len:464 (+),score=98.81 TRINITY_DN17899_c0_g1_i2:88-1479(+)
MAQSSEVSSPGASPPPQACDHVPQPHAQAASTPSTPDGAPYGRRVSGCGAPAGTVLGAPYGGTPSQAPLETRVSSGAPEDTTPAPPPPPSAPTPGVPLSAPLGRPHHAAATAPATPPLQQELQQPQKQEPRPAADRSSAGRAPQVERRAPCIVPHKAAPGPRARRSTSTAGQPGGYVHLHVPARATAAGEPRARASGGSCTPSGAGPRCSRRSSSGSHTAPRAPTPPPSQSLAELHAKMMNIQAAVSDAIGCLNRALTPTRGRRSDAPALPLRQGTVPQLPAAVEQARWGDRVLARHGAAVLVPPPPPPEEEEEAGPPLPSTTSPTPETHRPSGSTVSPPHRGPEPPQRASAQPASGSRSGGRAQTPRGRRPKTVQQPLQRTLSAGARRRVALAPLGSNNDPARNAGVKDAAPGDLGGIGLAKPTAASLAKRRPPADRELGGGRQLRMMTGAVGRWGTGPFLR